MAPGSALFPTGWRKRYGRILQPDYSVRFDRHGITQPSAPQRLTKVEIVAVGGIGQDGAGRQGEKVRSQESGVRSQSVDS